MENPLGLTCPKCRGAMSSYERAGVVIDQCQECRGIFLDRGELERLLDVSTGHQPVAAQPDERQWRQQPPQHREWNRSRNDWDDDSDSHRRGSGSYGHGKPKKKHSLLREFLDFG